jgi:hypothetical protein
MTCAKFYCHHIHVVVQVGPRVPRKIALGCGELEHRPLVGDCHQLRDE